jgi:hypothetical protein
LAGLLLLYTFPKGFPNPEFAMRVTLCYLASGLILNLAFTFNSFPKFLHPSIRFFTFTPDGTIMLKMRVFIPCFEIVEFSIVRVSTLFALTPSLEGSLAFGPFSGQHCDSRQTLQLEEK